MHIIFYMERKSYADTKTEGIVEPNDDKGMELSTEAKNNSERILSE